ncbi:MAG TPA: Uma2 family endonuclease [Pseudonocardiaceae bacterium]|jgi:Uma2 family endonuclease
MSAKGPMNSPSSTADFSARNALNSQNPYRVNLLIKLGERSQALLDMPYARQLDRGVDTVSAEVVNPMGPYTVEDWLAEDPPSDGSKRELILGKIEVSLSASGPHNLITHWLARHVDDALDEAGRDDLHVLPTANLKISTVRRTALIPDIAILNIWPERVAFLPAQVELVVEVWSPGNDRDERSQKFDAYAYARIPYFWTVDLDGPVVNAHELRGGQYQLAATLKAGEVGTITAAPIPVTFDPAALLHRRRSQ